MSLQPLKNVPDFIIVGAMKCATSTLHDQLKMHKSFFMTTPKEPNFFSDDALYEEGALWYESLFGEALPGQCKGESSTHYTKLPTYPNTVDRLAYHCPHLKCIYIMRHPVDRLVSHYIHEWTQRVISCDINQAVRRFPELIDYGCYAMQIEPYLSAFGPQNVLPVFLEKITINPEYELKRIFQFLKVIEKPVWQNGIQSNVSSERLRASKWRDAIVKNPVLRHLRRAFVPKSFRDYVKNFWKMKERPVLSLETLKTVETIFDNDLNRLGGLLGIQLDCRRYKEIIKQQDGIGWKVY